jgi:hypothetical protein
MVGMKVFAAASAALSTFASAAFALDVDLKSNLAVYWVRHFV